METGRKPSWINKKVDFREMHATEELLSGLSLHTVCHQAKCPNISECFGKKTATFMILGDTCTRSCAFCSVKKGRPVKPDTGEPENVTEAVKRMGLKYVIITSVTRDDLQDKGASFFAACVRNIKKFDGSIKVEVLTPDFKGDLTAVDTVINESPDVFAHNVETVPSLYKIRKGADYTTSLRVIGHAKKTGVKVKSGIMLGLGEKEYEVLAAMRDLRMTGCDFLSIGQYLQPKKDNIKVKEYIRPEKFDYYRELALSMGFLHVESGPYVRSSYRAENYLRSRLKFQMV